jgi:hypothetical protein
MAGTLATLCVGAVAFAQEATHPQDRRVELLFTPAPRAQMAIWIEQADGTFMTTVRLTESVAYRGIGNRPGANQMNTGFRYPYGRREGALPVWAHRRRDAGGALFPRVLFWGRMSRDGVHAGEGYASISEDPTGSNTVDDHFCLSFADEANALDAVTCASVFRSNKGRYVTSADVSSGLAVQPWQNTEPRSHWSALSTQSLYPPRRDMGTCSTCADHPDVFRFAQDARAAMPEIDAVTMATLRGSEPYTLRFAVPPDWPDGDYVAWLEVHVEADYNEFWNPDIYGPPAPDPSSGDDHWDYWAHARGIPWRGQPSVVFRVPFQIVPHGGEWTVSKPHGHGEMHGLHGSMALMETSPITDDPSAAPGSGADRLRLRPDGTRLRVVVKPTDVCMGENAPALCGEPCDDDAFCAPDGLDCSPRGVCADPCDASFEPPPLVPGLEVLPHPDPGRSHHHAILRFTVPESHRSIVEFHARYQPGRIEVPDAPDTAWFTSTLELPIKDTELEASGLVLPTPPPGSVVEVEIGGLAVQSRHVVGIRAEDQCGRVGPIATAEMTTTEIHFATVSPCFVATAAYGSPLEPRVGVLRRLRDRHLQNHSLGRALVSAYYRAGARAAVGLEQAPWLRPVVRAGLTPLVALADLIAN